MNKTIDIKIFLIKADLNRSTKVCSKMNPFVRIITKQEIIDGAICKHGDKKPIWNDAHLLKIQEGETMFLQIMDFNSRDNSEMIAQTSIHQAEIIGFNGKKEVHYQNHLVGQIELQIQHYTFPKEYLSQQVGNIQQMAQNQIRNLPQKYQYPSVQ